MTTISIIAAVALNNAIGRKGDLLYHIGDDLRRFKAITMGHPIIMGRKTFESFPKGALPGRRNIVISRNPRYNAPDIEVTASLADALALVNEADEAFVLGGGEIYRQAMPMAKKLYLTRIEAVADDADTFFPEIGNEWSTIEKTPEKEDERSGVSYFFETLAKNIP